MKIAKHDPAADAHHASAAMINNTENKKGSGGFTLVELLVVLTITAILTSIAMPVFAHQLERAREAVDMSNAHASSSLAYTEYMLCHAKGRITYTFGVDGKGALFILSHTDEEGVVIDDGSNADGVEIESVSEKLRGTSLTVTLEGGRIEENSWLSVLNGE